MKSKRSIIGKRSKEKGNSYECKIAKLLSAELGIDLRRVPASGSLDLKGDICRADFKPLNILIDTKNYKSLLGARLMKEMHKAEEDGKKAKVADRCLLIIHEYNTQNDYVLMPLAFLLELLKKTDII